MFSASSPGNTCVSSYKNSSIHECDLARIRSRIRSPNPCECAEERSFKRKRASDCLSEASSSSTPLEASTGRCPQRSEGTQTPGSPFLLLTLLLAKQRKVSRPPRRQSGTRTQQCACSFDQKTNSESGVFGVGAQIPRAFGLPFGCCASLRSEIVIRPQKPGCTSYL